MTLDTWQLVGYTVSIRTDTKGLTGSIFVGSTVNVDGTYPSMTTAMDLSIAAVLRVGGAGTSFIGSVFGVRIATPGGGFLPPCNPFCALLS